MIDLTNRTIDEINELIQKYISVLELIKQQKQIPYLAIVIDVGIKYVKEKYQDLELDWKAWSIVYLKHKYLRGKIKKESDIPNLIDDFIKYYKDKYKSYVDNLGMSTSDFDRDYGFVCAYINR
jgi:hypothetical protein